MPLRDLEENILSCRRSISKPFVVEATRCYQSGAYRACIVTVWSAICFDIMEKLQILANLGNEAAKRIIEKNEQSRDRNDVAQLLDFERKILDVAHKEFHLLTKEEYVELGRTQIDRNRCAHPTMIDAAKPFAPSAELARYHLFNAVDLLISQEPIQGRVAAEKVLAEIDSKYFPETLDAAKASLMVGPLGNPRPSLVKAVTKTLVDRAIDFDDPTIGRKYQVALQAVLELQANIGTETLKSSISTSARKCDHFEFVREIHYLHQFPSHWDYFPVDRQNKILGFASNFGGENISFIDLICNVPQLRSLAIAHLGTYSVDRIIKAISPLMMSSFPPEAVLFRIKETALDFNSIEQQSAMKFMANHPGLYSPEDRLDVLEHLKGKAPESMSKEAILVSYSFARSLSGHFK